MREHRAAESGQQEMRQRILEAAEKLFADKGFDATSISDISEASGAGRSLIYYYFRDKQDLHGAILQDGLDRMLGVAEAAAAFPGTALEKLGRFMETFSQLHALRQDFVRVAMRARVDRELVSDEHARRHLGELLGVLVGIVRVGMAKGELREVDPERVVHLVMGLTHALVMMQLKAMPEAAPEENVRAAVDLLAHGIARGNGRRSRVERRE